MAKSRKAEVKEGNRLVKKMLDAVHPFEEGMSEEQQYQIEMLRSTIETRTGWGTFPVEHLRLIQ